MSYFQNYVAFQIAAKNGDIDTVKYYVSRGILNIHFNDEIVLRRAAENGHFEIVKYLISNGADIHIHDDHPLRYAVLKGNLEMVKYLISHGANIHSYNECALKLAAMENHIEIVKYLIPHGVDIHYGNEYALRRAAEKGHLEIVKYLVSNGADIHVNNNEIMNIAIRDGKKQIVKYLIEECDYDPHINSNFSLRSAADNGYFEMMKYLIEECNCDPHVNNECILQNAIDNSRYNQMMYLIKEHNCDPHLNNEHPLRKATHDARFDIVKYLIEECKCDPHVILYNDEYDTYYYDRYYDYESEEEEISVYDHLKSLQNQFAQEIIQNYDQFQNQCYWIKQIINKQNGSCYASECTKWQKIAGTLGTHQLESLRSIVNQLEISYNCNENKLYEKRLLCKLLAQDLEKYQSKYNTISKRSNRYKSINETNLMGETNIPDYRYLYNSETQYFYDLDEIKKLNGICPYTRIPFSETFLKEIEEKEYDIRHKIHKMEYHEKNQYTIWKKSIINNIARIEEKTNCYFPTQRVMGMNLIDLKKVQEYLNVFVPKIETKNKMEYISKLMKEIEQGDTESIVTHLNAYLGIYCD